MIFQGIQTSIAKKPYIFVIFSGGGVWTPCPPSGSTHASVSIHGCYILAIDLCFRYFLAKFICLLPCLRDIFARICFCDEQCTVKFWEKTKQQKQNNNNRQQYSKNRANLTYPLVDAITGCNTFREKTKLLKIS